MRRGAVGRRPRSLLTRGVRARRGRHASAPRSRRSDGARPTRRRARYGDGTPLGVFRARGGIFRARGGIFRARGGIFRARGATSRAGRRHRGGVRGKRRPSPTSERGVRRNLPPSLVSFLPSFPALPSGHARARAVGGRSRQDTTAPDAALHRPGHRPSPPPARCATLSRPNAARPSPAPLPLAAAPLAPALSPRPSRARTTRPSPASPPPPSPRRPSPLLSLLAPPLSRGAQHGEHGARDEEDATLAAALRRRGGEGQRRGRRAGRRLRAAALKAAAAPHRAVTDRLTEHSRRSGIERVGVTWVRRSILTCATRRLSAQVGVFALPTARYARGDAAPLPSAELAEIAEARWRRMMMVDQNHHLVAAARRVIPCHPVSSGSGSLPREKE